MHFGKTHSSKQRRDFSALRCNERARKRCKHSETGGCRAQSNFSAGATLICALAPFCVCHWHVCRPPPTYFEPGKQKKNGRPFDLTHPLVRCHKGTTNCVLFLSFFHHWRQLAIKSTRAHSRLEQFAGQRKKRCWGEQKLLKAAGLFYFFWLGERKKLSAVYVDCSGERKLCGFFVRECAFLVCWTWKEFCNSLNKMLF